VKGTYRERTEAVWLSDSTLRACEDWLAEVGCGIVWTGSLDFGRELARRAGLTFYEQGGLSLAVSPCCTRGPGAP
jgi:hypothetical protein